MNTAKIVIPSYKRPDSVKALETLSESIQRKHVWIAVRAEELEEYRKHYPHCNYKVLPNVTNIAQTRQRINELFDGTILVIDDDVRFHTTTLLYETTNRKGETKKYENGIIKVQELLDDDGIEQMLSYVRELSQTYHYGTIRCFHFPRNEEYYPYTLNKPAIWCVWFNLDQGKFDAQKYNYENGPIFIEDVYMSIVYYDDGNDFAVVGKYAITKAHTTGGQDGGCQDKDEKGNVIRHIEHNRSAKWLVDNYPQYCVLSHSNQNSKTMGAQTNTVIAKLSERARQKRHQNTLENFFG
jgi:hypothetical protein